MTTARDRPGLHTAATTLAGVKQLIKALKYLWIKVRCAYLTSLQKNLLVFVEHLLQTHSQR